LSAIVINGLPRALLSKCRGGRCLSYIGREGRLPEFVDDDAQAEHFRHWLAISHELLGRLQTRVQIPFDIGVLCPHAACLAIAS
jgi:hypothetical protein